MAWSDILKISASILASIGGAGVLIVALANWLGKVWANRILEADRLRYNQEFEQTRNHYAQQLEQLKSELEATTRRIQTGLEKTIHTYRIQFETEFKALSVIWEKLAAVRASMSGLRPHVDIVDLNESSEERLNRRFKRFQQTHQELSDAVHNQSPFYPEDIYQELSEVLTVCRREADDVVLECHELRDSSWFKRGEQNFSELRHRAENVSSKIRKRIESLMVH